MQWAASWLCIAAPLFLLCFAPSCPSAQKYPKCWHDRRTQIRQKQHSRKTFCDPSFSNQTAGAKCSSGFYREWAGPNRGQCVPCSCNGLSDECDERTGNCVVVSGYNLFCFNEGLLSILLIFLGACSSASNLITCS
uniref:Uncharacterized protein n=1 Tax=Oreochromis niloticus TaxID=8128 RepID=A0A669DFX1_ORENI